MIHTPVLLKEILEYLKPESGEKFIDCTFGFGGHSFAILEKVLPGGSVLGIEIDKDVFDQNETGIDPPSPRLRRASGKTGLTLINDSYVNLKKIADENGFNKVDGILLDLGISSWHFDKSEKGFSFKDEEQLDMRLDSGTEKSASDIVNHWDYEDLVKIFSEYGEERFSKRIAKAITEYRKKKAIKTTADLVNVIREAIPGKFVHSKTHFATKVFQALRIAVNDELQNVEKVLPQAIEILKPGGIIAVISFHSGEDRIVKHFFKNLKNEIEILTKKPIVAGDEEIKNNPRARSAKLRVVTKHETNKNKKI
ncbi:16S rRNA (cytosine(1402)-N(4))-methyltransferase RsmH [bacterium]|nr:MAG: 16S rRNA (cytosine(1402)-N(4))-methyltransferase RsmH [bacterium]